jgi:phosphoribosylpyrophosphate synthetase
MIDRVRLYAVTEASTPGIWYPLVWRYTSDEYYSLSNLNSYVGASLSANQAETYGYPITHCSLPDIDFPRSAPTQPKDWYMTCGRVYETVTPSYFSTNQVWNIIGDVSGRVCILVDDIVDSAGTLCNAAEALKQQGAISVAAYCCHGVLSNGAVERVEKSALDMLVVSDSIPASAAALVSKRIEIVSVAPLIGEAIRRIANEESVSKLFD